MLRKLLPGLSLPGDPPPALDAVYLEKLDALPSQLVFIMGCHRSGTSLLHHLLAYTGQVDYISAYNIIKYDELIYNRVTGREIEVKAALQSVLQSEATRGLDELPVGADLPEEYRFLMHEQKQAIVLDFKKRLVKLFFTPHLTPDTLDTFLTICRKKRFLAEADRPLILKNPADYYFNFWAVHQMLPQAKFIFIHRHPLDMFNSYLHGFPALLSERSNYAALIDPRYNALFGRLRLRRQLFLHMFRSDRMCHLLMERFAESYRYYMTYIRQLPSEQYTSVRYEDLCDDPEGCLSAIGEQLRIDLVPRIASRFVAPRHLPLWDQVKRHYASWLADLAPYLEHCDYEEWPDDQGAAGNSLKHSSASSVGSNVHDDNHARMGPASA